MTLIRELTQQLVRELVNDLAGDVGISLGPINTVAPVISGTAERGQTLSSTNGTWTGTGTITFARQWFRNGAPISGATNATYTTVAADDNANITITIAATDDEGTTNATSNSIGPILGAPFNLVAPVVSGTEQVGQTLSVTTGTWQGLGTITFSYQWRRNDVNISGATSNTYDSVSADYDITVDCVVTGTNGLGATNQDSNDTGAIAGIVPSAFTAGQWSVSAGNTEITVTVSTLPSGAVPAIDQIDYRLDGGSWIDSGISGTGSFDITGLTNGVEYTVEIRASNAEGVGPDSDDKTATPAEGPVNLTPPVVSGVSGVGVGYNGQTLSTTNGTWTGSPSGFTYQWQSNSVNITGATSSTYQVTSTTEGTSLTCDVTATNAQGSGTESSNAIHNWIPTDSSATFVSWWDFSDDTQISLNGSSITQITDKGNLSETLTQSTSANRPTINTANLNGLNTASLDGVNDFLIGSSLSKYNFLHQGDNGTVAILFDTDDGRGFQAPINTHGGTSNIGFQILTNDSDNVNIFVRRGVSGTSSVDDRPANSFLRMGIGFSILCFELDANNGIAGNRSQISENGLNVSQNNVLTNLPSTNNHTNPLTIGADASDTSSRNLIGDIADIVIFSNHTDVQKVQGYMAWKWGLTSLLPSGHPYKTTAPSP